MHSFRSFSSTGSTSSSSIYPMPPPLKGSSSSSNTIGTSAAAPITISIPPPLHQTAASATTNNNQNSKNNTIDKKLETHLLRQSIALILFGRGFQKTHKGSMDVLCNILEGIVMNILKDLKRTGECLPSPITLPTLEFCGGHYGSSTTITIQDAFPLLLPSSSATLSYSPPKYLPLYRSLECLIDFVGAQPSTSEPTKYRSILEHKGLIPSNSSILPVSKTELSVFGVLEEDVDDGFGGGSGGGVNANLDGSINNGDG